MMKRKVIGLTALFLLSGMAQADDYSSSVTINGLLLDETVINACQIELSRSSIALAGKTAEEIPAFGENSPSADQIKLVVLPRILPFDECAGKINDGKMAFRLTGIGDSTTPSVLANTMTGDNAANGVAVALYNNDGTPAPLGSIINLSAYGSGHGIAFIRLGLVKLNGQTVTTGQVQSNLTVEVARL